MITLRVGKDPGKPVKNHEVVVSLSANSSNIKCAEHENLDEKFQCSEGDNLAPSEAVRVVVLVVLIRKLRTTHWWN